MFYSYSAKKTTCIVKNTQSCWDENGLRALLRVTPQKQGFSGGGVTPSRFSKLLGRFPWKFFWDIFNPFWPQKKIFGPRRIFYAPRIFCKVQLFWKNGHFRWFWGILDGFWKILVENLRLQAIKYPQKSLDGQKTYSKTTYVAPEYVATPQINFKKSIFWVQDTA